MKKFYWFGDSWVYGDELSTNDQQNNTFAKLISNHFNAECVNLSIRGSSINSITHEFTKNIDKIDPSVDMVFFGLTSNIRTSLFDDTGKLKNILPRYIYGITYYFLTLKKLFQAGMAYPINPEKND